MDLLQFNDLSLFGSIILDEESLILKSKDSRYAFYINFKDEIKGVDHYDLAIVTEKSEGFINKSGPAKIIHKAVMDILNGEVLSDDIKKVKPQSKPKSAKSNNSAFYKNIKGRR